MSSQRTHWLLEAIAASRRLPRGPGILTRSQLFIKPRPAIRSQMFTLRIICEIEIIASAFLSVVRGRSYRLKGKLKTNSKAIYQNERVRSELI